MKQSIRVRFTTSSSESIDLDSIRTALVNSLFAKKHHSDFALRINDTNIKNFSHQDKKTIIEIFSWLKITIDEGPILVSTRTETYQTALHELIGHQKVYRCFCPSEILERKREQQIMMGKSFRYDRSCLLLPQEKIKQKVAFGLPFVWRLKINEFQILTIQDLNQKSIDLSMTNVSDPVLTNTDGSVSNLFAQFVDDWKLGITHLIYSKKHLADTTFFATLYDIFALNAPVFWHLPILSPNKVIKLASLSSDLSTDLIAQLQADCTKSIQFK